MVLRMCDKQALLFLPFLSFSDVLSFFISALTAEPTVNYPKATRFYSRNIFYILHHFCCFGLFQFPILLHRSVWVEDRELESTCKQLVKMSRREREKEREKISRTKGKLNDSIFYLYSCVHGVFAFVVACVPMFINSIVQVPRLNCTWLVILQLHYYHYHSWRQFAGTLAM